MSILTVTKLNKEYFARTVLQNINFNLNEQDHLALVGENGSGKTTFLKIVAQMEEPDSGSIYLSQNILLRYLDQKLDDFDAIETPLDNKELDAIQENIAQLSHHLDDPISLKKYNEQTDAFDRLGGYDYKARLSKILKNLGVSEELLTRPVSLCSGGEKMRIKLGKMLVQRPDLLLLDEPTNHLDLQAIHWLESYLLDFKGAFIVVSHDRYFLDRVCNRVAFLEHGQITTFNGNYTQSVKQQAEQEAFLADEKKRLELLLEQEMKITQTLRSHRDITGFHSRQKRVDKVQAELDELKTRMASGPKRLSFHFTPKPLSGDPNKIILSTKKLEKSFPDLDLFHDVNLTIKAHEKAVIVGPNGSGKSTLFNILTQKDKNYSGQVIRGEDVKWVYMDQNTRFENTEKNALETLLDHSRLDETDARNQLARFGFRDIDVFKKISVLSGGEKSRLFLCCLLEKKPQLLLLDEPTNHLDIYSRTVLEDVITHYDGAVLAISHDRYFINNCLNTVINLTKNGLKYFPSVEAYLNQESYEKEKTQTPKTEKTGDKKQTEINPSKKRKLKVQIQKEVQNLETAILELETKKEEITASIDASTPPNVFVDLANMDQELEKLYEAYTLAHETMLTFQD